MTELLPTELGQQEVEYLHNWLYSVLPITPEHKLPNGNFREQRPSDRLILSGYCRNCDQAFAREIPVHSGQLIYVTEMGVPKTGCVGSR